MGSNPTCIHQFFMGSVRSMALGASCYTYLGVAARKGVAGSNPVDSTSLGSNGEYSGSIPVNGGPGLRAATRWVRFPSYPPLAILNQFV